MGADVRAMFVATMIAQKDVPALQDAALGWLLDDAAEVREALAQMLEKNADGSSGVTLRRFLKV